MAVIKEKAPMVLGIGAALAGVLLLFRKKKPTLPEAPPNSVVIGLWNTPSGSDFWHLMIADWEWTGQRTLYEIPIDEPAIFSDIPEAWVFPLKIDLSIFQRIDPETATQLYRAQSHHPYLWDFDKMEYGDEPDPAYREVFIPDYGNYYYNVSKERFEQ